VQDLLLPELHPNMRIIKPIECLVAEHLASCDILLGRDFLEAVSIDILFSAKQLRWMEYMTTVDRGIEGSRLPLVDCVEGFQKT
jgi:hypothetical protein